MELRKRKDIVVSKQCIRKYKYNERKRKIERKKTMRIYDVPKD